MKSPKNISSKAVGLFTALALLASLIILPLSSASAVAGQVDANNVTVAPTIDGLLNEAGWNLATTVSKTTIGAPNNTVTFGTMWDANYFYVGVKVLDANLKNDSANVWDDDAVEVMMDANHNKATTYDSYDRQYLKGYNDSTLLAAAGSGTGVLHASAAITGGYSVELAIPWSNLAVTPSAGLAMGLDIGYDDDDTTNAARDGQAVWWGTVNDWGDTSVFGDVVLTSGGATATNTPLGPTATNTSVPPTATRTSTPVGPTATNTPVPPTATATNTAVNTSVPPTATATSQPGTCTRFVATTGNDANDGLTINTPWRTIQKAASTAQPGNIVCVRGGSYNELVTVNVSGSAAGGYITFQSYPGETAILDGTNLPVPAGWAPVLRIQDKGYLIVKGFEIRNYQSNVVGNNPIGIFVTGAGDHIELRNNKVHDMGNYAVSTSTNMSAHGIAVYGTNGTSSINNVILDGNELYNLHLGWSESMVLNGNVQYWSVTNNLIHDNNNIGIDIIGFEGKSPNSATDQARDGVVANNTVYNIDLFTNPADPGQRYADGIYVDGGTRVVIERNIIHHANIGLEVASEWGGKTVDYITVRNNLIYSNTQIGISIGGYDRKRGITANCIFENNTLYNNVTQGDWGAEFEIQYYTNNNIIRNNIFYAGSGRKFLEVVAAPTATTFDNNVYFAAGGGTTGSWAWLKHYYTTFATYQAGTGLDTNSIIGVDPLFVNTSTPDLHLQSTSPMINAGVNLPDVGSVDLDGQPRIQGGTIDFGADEVP